MTADSALPHATWTIIIPVKATSVAKTRLGALGDPARTALALAFALDTADAALTSDVVRAVVAVTNDPTAADRLRAAGATVIADGPDAGLNPALSYAVERVREADAAAGVAALSADLPALRPEELTIAVRRAGVAPRWFVPDHRGSGTTLLAAGPGADLEPVFGADSAAAHRRSGAVEVSGEDLPGLRRDVDTRDDLTAAVRLGLGARTTRAAERLGLLAALGA